MSHATITFPTRLDTNSALRFAHKLRSIESASYYEIDFGNCNWIEPFSALLASSEITRFKNAVGPQRVKVKNHERMSYAAHIGFFHSFGFRHGNTPGQATGGSTYQPIQILLAKDIQASADSQSTAIGAVMEGHADNLASVLCQAKEGNIYSTLSYSMREIMRNVIEHSGADRVGYCAQYWPTKEKVEVAVMDWGIGIKRGLQQNPKLRPTTDAEALKLALLPGVSGKGEQVKRLRIKGPWTNSGYGLYMTSRLCRVGGTFLIASGESALLLSGKQIFPTRWGIDGTSIRMQINIADIRELTNELERFRKEAHNFRHENGGIEYLTPSTASRALTERLNT